MIKVIVRALRMFKALHTVSSCAIPPVLQLKDAVLTLKELGFDEGDPRYREAQRVLLANAMAFKAYRLAYSMEQVISLKTIAPCPEKWKLENLDFNCVCAWGEEE
ncbi:MAG: hypothetical protein ACLQF0_07860 [Dissulfurispiraceae bacterium]